LDRGDSMSKNKFSKGLIVLIVLSNMVAAGISFWLFAKTGGEPVATLGVWFGFSTGELWIMATVKKAKIKNSKEGAGNDEN